jgi:fatty acid desaturase
MNANPITVGSDPISTMDHKQRSAYIRKKVLSKGDELRTKYPFLQNQNLMAIAVLAFSLVSIANFINLYIQGYTPAWFTIPLLTIFMSFIHELEHDLIHWTYFRHKKWMHHLMLSIGLLARPTTVLPWLRRDYHMNHHKHSGTDEDAEEIAITNGQPWGVMRFLMLVDLPFTILVHTIQKPNWSERFKYIALMGAALFPLGFISWGLWYCFLGFHLINGLAIYAGYSVAWSASTLASMQLIELLVVVWIAPNILRTFCLNFMSSNMHYCQDNQPGNVIQETQVLNSPWFLPLNLLAGNVGATHGIHHFVVKEPFYIREMTLKTAHKVMAECGVRFNDYRTFLRANRYHDNAPTTQPIATPATS